MYQTNLLVAMGVIGSLVVLYLFYRAVREYRTASNKLERLFWLLLTFFCTILGIAVHGERADFGVAHICLAPIVLLGILLLAGSFPRLPRAVRLLVVVG